MSYVLSLAPKSSAVQVLRNPTLTLKERGLFAYLVFTKPGAITFSAESLMQELPEGREQLRATLKSLYERGHVVKVRK